jgi:Na+-driven multidrug efflux pump
LPIGVYLAFSNYAGVPNEAEGIWIGMIIGISISAVLNTLRLKHKKNLLKKLY